MRLRAAQNRLKVEHSIIDGLRQVLERLLRDNSEIRSVIPGVIRQVRDAKGTAVHPRYRPHLERLEGHCAQCRCASGVVHQYCYGKASS